MSDWWKTLGLAEEDIAAGQILRNLIRAYAGEWLTCYRYLHAANCLNGLYSPSVADLLRRRAKDELNRGQRLARRITQLGGSLPSDLVGLGQQSEPGAYPAPPDPADLEGLLQWVLETEQYRTAVYATLAEKARDIDPATHQLATELRAEEVADREEAKAALAWLRRMGRRLGTLVPEYRGHSAHDPQAGATDTGWRRRGPMKVSAGYLARLVVSSFILTATLAISACTLAAQARPTAQQPQVREIQLLMGDPSTGEFTFAPETITVKNGETVRLLMKNTGRTLHEIRSDLFRFIQSDVEVEGIEIETMGLREIELPPGKELEVGMTIRVSTDILAELDGKARYEFGCFVPGHYKAGMKGTIIVEA